MSRSPCRYYCTYFDHRYATPALLLMESILQFERNSKFFCLCQDQKAFEIMSRVGGEFIEAIRVEDLEAADPELAAARHNRKLIEFYFTCTPAFPNFLLNKHPEIDIITYLDADLFFYAPPQRIFDEIGDRSVAIVPHRFSPVYENCRPFGTYNVGWVSWRNDAIGRRCLADYRAQCLEWCYDRLEATRFADQKYLNYWPERYPNLCVVENIGTNVAVWNVDNYQISNRNGVLHVNDQRVVFYHFHGIRISPQGRWAVHTHPTIQNHKVLMEDMYRPYVARLDEKQAALRKAGFDAIEATEIRYPGTAAPAAAPTPAASAAPAAQGTPTAFRFVGHAWPVQEAKPAETPETGWAAQHLVAVRGRQLAELQHQLASPVPFGAAVHDQINNVLPCLVLGALKPPGSAPVRVLDWGGAMGGMGRLLRTIFPDTPLEYVVKELPHICEVGRQLNPDAVFIEREEDLLDRRFDIVLLNSALQYAADWQSVLTRLAGLAERGVFVGRQPMVGRAPSYVAEQHAYGTFYPGWVLREAELGAAAQAAGLTLVWKMFAGDAFAVAGAPEQPRCFSYLFRPTRTGARA